MQNTIPVKIDAFFLDFDGVVIESTDIKTQAFYELYLPFGADIAEKARAYHLQFQGVSRFQKFKDIHAHYLHRACEEAEQQELSARFSEIVMQNIMACPTVDGVEDFLKEQNDNSIPLFLFSATPHDELLDITHKRGLASYFLQIYGSPATKPESGRIVLKQYNLNAEKVLFIGDSPSDEKASEELGTLFVGRISSAENSIFKNPVRSIHSFRELL